MSARCRALSRGDRSGCTEREILFEDRAGAYGYPASVTKLMTMLLTLEAIDRGETETDRAVINNEVAGIGGSQLYLDPKERDLL